MLRLDLHRFIILLDQARRSMVRKHLLLWVR